MNIKLEDLVVSLSLVMAIVCWISLYWLRNAPRWRQWLRYSLLVGLVYGLWIIWLSDSYYSIRITWMGELYSRLELWILTGVAISLLSMLWLRLPNEKSLSQVVTLKYNRLALAIVAMVCSAMIASVLKQDVMLALIASVGVLGLWRASYKLDYIVASILCMLIAGLLLMGVGFGAAWLWPNLAGFKIGSWWTIFDLPSYALMLVSAFGVGPLCWWWMNQSSKAS